MFIILTIQKYITISPVSLKHFKHGTNLKLPLVLDLMWANSWDLVKAENSVLQLLISATQRAVYKMNIMKILSYYLSLLEKTINV